MENGFQNLALRQPCRHCGGTVGRIETKGGQDCVYCNECGRYAGYNAPKTETGRAPRTMTTIHNGIKPGQRYRILQRASGHCEVCGKAGTPLNPLHVDHLLSVKEGLAQNLTDAQINHDENLGALCDECNAGKAEETMPIWMILGIIRARAKNRIAGDDKRESA